MHKVTREGIVEGVNSQIVGIAHTDDWVQDPPHRGSPAAQRLCPGTSNGTARSAVDGPIGRPSVLAALIR